MLLRDIQPEMAVTCLPAVGVVLERIDVVKRHTLILAEPADAEDERASGCDLVGR